jgi:hypothetical protein
VEKEKSAIPETEGTPAAERAAWQAPKLVKFNAELAENTGGSGGDNDVFS